MRSSRGMEHSEPTPEAGRVGGWREPRAIGFAHL